MPLILDRTQAEAVYRAMCELNSFNARVAVRFKNATGATAVWVHEMRDGKIEIEQLGDSYEEERYANQSDFATAYDLQQG